MWKLKPTKHFGWFFQNEDIETIAIITKDTDDFLSFCSCRIDLLIVKKEIWESNENMRDSLSPCLRGIESLILI